jgi:hypothetical protein
MIAILNTAWTVLHSLFISDLLYERLMLLQWNLVLVNQCWAEKRLWRWMITYIVEQSGWPFTSEWIEWHNIKLYLRMHCYHLQGSLRTHLRPLLGLLSLPFSFASLLHSLLPKKAILETLNQDTQSFNRLARFFIFIHSDLPLDAVRYWPSQDKRNESNYFSPPYSSRRDGRNESN